jgi:hypothetical protein
METNDETLDPCRGCYILDRCRNRVCRNWRKLRVGILAERAGPHRPTGPASSAAGPVPADSRSAVIAYSVTETQDVQNDDQDALPWWESGFTSRRQLQNEIESHSGWGNG